MPVLPSGPTFFRIWWIHRSATYPSSQDEPGGALNEGFLLGAPNLPSGGCPEYAHLASALRVIDVREAAAGRVLRIFMNADEEEALGLLVRV